MLFALILNKNIFSCVPYQEERLEGSISFSKSQFLNNPFLSPECLEYVAKNVPVSPKKAPVPIRAGGCLLSERCSPIAIKDPLYSNDPFDPIYCRVKSPLIIVGALAPKE